ncbi:Hypothetical protein NocV09_10900100 [Nannochloropsis oceanica]
MIREEGREGGKEGELPAPLDLREAFRERDQKTVLQFETAVEEWSATQRPVNDLLSSPPSSFPPSSSFFLFFPREISPVARLDAAYSSSSCWGWTYVPLHLTAAVAAAAYDDDERDVCRTAAVAAAAAAAAAEGGDEKWSEKGRERERKRRKVEVEGYGEGERGDTPPY